MLSLWTVTTSDESLIIPHSISSVRESREWSGRSLVTLLLLLTPLEQFLTNLCPLVAHQQMRLSLAISIALYDKRESMRMEECLLINIVRLSCSFSHVREVEMDKRQRLTESGTVLHFRTPIPIFDALYSLLCSIELPCAYMHLWVCVFCLKSAPPAVLWSTVGGRRPGNDRFPFRGGSYF